MQDNEPNPSEERNLDQGPQSVGQILKEAREAQRLDLEKAAAELRFEPRVLVALENDRLDELGPPVFARGYLKQYAKLLGLDAAELVARYEAAAGQREFVLEPSRTIKLRDDRQVTVWTVAALVLLLIAIAFLAWWAREPLELPGDGEIPEQTLPVPGAEVVPGQSTDRAGEGEGEPGENR